MLYALFILVFLMLLAIYVVVKKQNSYFQKHGLKVTGRAIAIEERTVKTKKRSGASKTRMVPVIEYSHKSQTWHFESDENNNITQRKVGDVVDLVVHAEHPLVMTQKDLQERATLSFIFMGLLVVPLVMCFGVYQFSKQTSELMLFEALGITAQHLHDMVALLIMVKLVSKVFVPVWKRWKSERDTSFWGLPFNAQVVNKHRAIASATQEGSIA